VPGQGAIPVKTWVANLFGTQRDQFQ
jgi:hypothetical protein